MTRSKGVRTLSPWGSRNAVPDDALLPYPVACCIRDRTQYLYLRRCPVCQEAKAMFAYRQSCSTSCKGVLLSFSRSAGQVADMQRRSVECRSARATMRDLEIIREQRLDAIAAYRLGRRRGYRQGESVGRSAERRRWEKEILK